MLMQNSPYISACALPPEQRVDFSIDRHYFSLSANFKGILDDIHTAKRVDSHTMAPS
jgi:hypothetical protein